MLPEGEVSKCTSFAEYDETVETDVSALIPDAKGRSITAAKTVISSLGNQQDNSSYSQPCPVEVPHNSGLVTCLRCLRANTLLLLFHVPRYSYSFVILKFSMQKTHVNFLKCKNSVPPSQHSPYPLQMPGGKSCLGK